MVYIDCAETDTKPVDPFFSKRRCCCADSLLKL